MNYTDITGRPTTDFKDFDELKKQRGAILSLQGMRHISGMKSAFDTKCCLMMSVNSIYIDEMYGNKVLLPRTNNSVVLSMSYIKNIELIDRESLKEALERDKGNPFYQFLAYGKPGLLQEEGFKKPSLLSKFSPSVLAIEQGNFYDTATRYRMPTDPSARAAMLNTSRYHSDVSNERGYENRDVRYDYYCFKVKKTSTFMIKNGLIEEFKNISRNEQRSREIMELGRRR